MTGINIPILLPTGGTDGNYHLNKASYREFGFRDPAGIGQIRQISPASYRGPGWQDEMAKSEAEGTAEGTGGVAPIAGAATGPVARAGAVGVEPLEPTAAMIAAGVVALIEGLTAEATYSEIVRDVLAAVAAASSPPSVDP